MLKISASETLASLRDAVIIHLPKRAMVASEPVVVERRTERHCLGRAKSIQTRGRPITRSEFKKLFLFNVLMNIAIAHAHDRLSRAGGEKETATTREKRVWRSSGPSRRAVKTTAPVQPPLPQFPFCYSASSMARSSSTEDLGLGAEPIQMRSLSDSPVSPPSPSPFRRHRRREPRDPTNPQPPQDDNDNDNSDDLDSDVLVRTANASRLRRRGAIRIEPTSSSSTAAVSPPFLVQHDIQLADFENGAGRVYCAGLLGGQPVAGPSTGPSPLSDGGERRRSVGRCGTLVHERASASERLGVWLAHGHGKRNIGFLESDYVDTMDGLFRIGSSKCGCLNEGLGCRAW